MNLTELRWVGVLLAIATYLGCSTGSHRQGTSVAVERKVGELNCQGMEVNGHRHGQWECRYPNGQTSIRINYHFGSKNGVSESWLEDGTPDFINSWKDNWLDGPFISFHRNGREHIRAHYTRGTLNGTLIEFEPSGERMTESQYRMNQLHGVRLEWYPGGRVLKSKQVFVNGSLEGPASEWYPDGRLREVILYHNGRPVSTDSDPAATRPKKP